MDFLVFLVLSDGGVKVIKITNPRIEAFFKEEREGFPDNGVNFLFDGHEIPLPAQEIIRAWGVRPEDLKVIHLWSLIALAGRRKRKDIFGLLRRLQERFYITTCLVAC